MAEAVEQVVSDRVLDALAVPELFSALENHDVDVDGLTRHMAQLEESLEQLARDFYAEQRISRREYLAAREELDRKLDDLRSQYGPATRSVSVVSELPGDADGLRELWEEATTDERRAIVDTVVQKIVIHPGKRGRGPVDPERVEIEWATG